MSQVDKNAMAQMISVSASYFDRLYRCETLAEFDAYLSAAVTEIQSSSYYAKLTSIDMVQNDAGNMIHDPTSLYGALFNWWRTNFDPNFTA